MTQGLVDSQLPPGTIVDGVDCGGMIDDPKQAGIPVFLQTQNHRPLSPEQVARVRALNAAARVVERQKLAERKAMAKMLGMSPAAMHKAGAVLKSETSNVESVMSKKSKTKSKTKRTAKAAAPRKVGEVRPGSKLEIVANLLKRTEGCTTADVLAATGWPSISMPQQAKAAGLTLQKEKDGSVTRYRAA